MVANEKIQFNDTSLLVDFVSRPPTLSNWGILVFNNSIIIFSKNGYIFEQSLVSETGSLDISRLREIPLGLVVPEPKYFAIPIIRASKDIGFHVFADTLGQDIICHEIVHLKNWGPNNVMAMKSPDPSKILFQTSNSTICFNPSIN